MLGCQIGSKESGLRPPPPVSVLYRQQACPKTAPTFGPNIDPKSVVRYLVFHCVHGNPVGGWGDFYGFTDSIEEARQWANTHGDEDSSCQIVDIKTGEEVE